MLRKFVVATLAGAVIYLASFFCMVSIPLNLAHDRAFPHIWRIHDYYFPIFELMKVSDTSHHVLRNIYSPMGDPDQISILHFLYMNPGIDLNIQAPPE